MTLELVLSIVGAAVIFALVRFVMKKPWAVSILAGLMVLLAVNIHWIKPALESVGTALGTNVVLGIAAVMMLVLLFMKVPVFVAVFAASAIYFLFNPGINQIIFGQKAITGTESASLLAIPFFVCAGVFMNYSGVTNRIMNFCSAVTGRLPGGLAQVNVLLSTLMGGLSGSNLADAAMEAKMLVPEITPLIPPGIAMILYGCIANVSIGKLFTSGIAVGGTLCIAMMVLVHFISKKRGYVPIRTKRMSRKEFWDCLRPALLPLCLPIIIIGGIRLGVFSATEAGAVAIIYAIVLGLIYKELSWKSILQACKETVTTTAGIMLIVSAASVFSWVLTKERVPQQLTEFIVSICPNGRHVHRRQRHDDRAGAPAGPDRRAVRHQRDPVRDDLHLQQRHRRPVSAHGHADVRHLLRHRLQDEDLHQGSGSVLHPAAGRADPVHVRAAGHHRDRAADLRVGVKWS